MLRQPAVEPPPSHPPHDIARDSPERDVSRQGLDLRQYRFVGGYPAKTTAA